MTLLLSRELNARLAYLSESDKDFWSFKGNAKREHGHGLFQYPAMMVPQMVRAILDEISAVYTNIRTIGDPFMGSGTVMTEAMYKGWNFIGYDINPLAVLLCEIKKGPFFLDALEEKIIELKERILFDKSYRIEIDFPGRNKWFRKDVQKALSKIKRSIQQDTSLWARKFFWIALAETVRMTSNSRTTTFKLHTRTTNDIETRDFDPVAIFKTAIDRNYNHLKGQTNQLKNDGHITRGFYNGNININLEDTCNVIHNTSQCDLIFTSPPYGDNATTVPYGQYSYLPLHWIDYEDIGHEINYDYLENTNSIDSHSLGGSKKIAGEFIELLCDRSTTYANLYNDLINEPKDRINRVTAFIRDIDKSLIPISSMLPVDGLIVWVLGNRSVGGQRIQLDDILIELLEEHNVHLVSKLARRIPSKRMATKNNMSETMSTESILIMRKAG